MAINSYAKAQALASVSSGRGGGPLLLQLLITLQGGIGQGLQIEGDGAEGSYSRGMRHETNLSF
jgi:hypothetical protein